MENGGFYKTTELYQACAHVEITGDGQGTPGPVTHFPGAFDAKDPGKLTLKSVSTRNLRQLLTLRRHLVASGIVQAVSAHG